jgi:serine/threonine-protein kinase
VTASDSSFSPTGQERLGTWLRGKYRLDAVLGVGGMALVFAVTHRNGRRFALKMLHPELSLRPDLRKRFLREGYIANAVGHAGAVAVLDDDVDEDSSAFLVMELLDGEGLDNMLSRHPEGIPVPAALSIAYQLLDVLASAHAKNIVHRDIKPGNLFATRTGELKVLDFGIARLQEPEGQATTRTGMTMGTPAFMSPEQAMGKPIDARADLFSVGATLFTLLSGRFVHQGDTGQELMVKAATEPAPPLASIAPQVPALVGAFVDRALAFGLSDRWQSAEMMQAAVADAFQTLAGEEISGAPLAAVVVRSHPSDALVSRPDVPPPATSPGLAPRAATPRTPTMPLPGAPASPLSSGDAPIVAPAASGGPVPGPENEKKGHPITGEPVASTKSVPVSGQPTAQASSGTRSVVIVSAGAAAFAVLTVGIVLFALRLGGHRAPPPTPASAAAVSVPPPAESVQGGAAGATATGAGASVVMTAPPPSDTAPAAPEPPEKPSAARAPAASTHAAGKSSAQQGHAASGGAAADAGSRRSDAPKADPWATP